MPGTLDQELTTTSSDVPDVEEKEHTSDIDADVDTESTQENDGERGTLVSESNRMDVAENLVQDLSPNILHQHEHFIRLHEWMVSLYSGIFLCPEQGIRNYLPKLRGDYVSPVRSLCPYLM